MPTVTMAHVARELGLSKNAVSLALRRDPQIPAPTRERVLAAARKLGYTLNPVVSQLMSELRRPGERRRSHALALINAYPSRDALRRHPTIPTYVEGCRRRATFHGYGLDPFWLHDPDLDGPRLNRILRARGIRGVIVVGTMDDPHLPEPFRETWAAHACVVTGVRTHDPTLSFCCVDHHALVLEAMENVRRLGYQRPALAIDRGIDRLVDGRFSAGMMIAQQAIPRGQRTATFHDVERARAEPALFHRWLAREKPDVILTLYKAVRRWVEGCGLRVPKDIGLVQLEHLRDHADWAGMDQHNDLTGEAAVDMVIGLLHNHEVGIPAHPRATLVEASWVPGPTVRDRNHLTVKKS